MKALSRIMPPRRESIAEAARLGAGEGLYARRREGADASRSQAEVLK